MSRLTRYGGLGAVLAVFLLFAATASAAPFDKDAFNTKMDSKMDSMKDEMATKFDDTQDSDESSSDDDGDSRTVIDHSETNTDTDTGENDASDTTEDVIDHVGNDDSDDESQTDNQDADTGNEPSDAGSDTDREPTDEDENDMSVSMDAKMDAMKAKLATKFADTDTGGNDAGDASNDDDSSSNDDAVDVIDQDDADDQDTGDDSSNDGSSGEEVIDTVVSNDDTTSGNEDTEDSVDESQDSDSEPAPQPDSSLEDRTESHLHTLLNEERTSRGLAPLDFDSDLAQSAQIKSDDMATRGYFSHQDPDGDNFRDIYNDLGIECRISADGVTYLGGENIATTWFDRSVRADHGGTVYYDTAEELAEGLTRQWMTSDGHRDAILRPYYDDHGLGIAITSSNKVYATEHFC